MRKERILAIVMAVFMALSLLPSMVFASASGIKLEGELKIKGSAAVGSELSANFEKVQPEGLSDGDVSYLWSRKTGEELKELTEEKSYKLTEEDIGSKIVLTVTGLEEKGYTGSLKVTSEEVSAVPVEEAPAEEIPSDEAGESADEAGESAEEEAVPEETAQPEEVPEETESEAEEEEWFPDEEVEELFPDEELLEIPESGAGTEETASGTADSGQEEMEASSSDAELPEEDWNQETYDEEELFPISIQETSGGTSEENENEDSEETPAYAAESYTEDLSGVVDFGTAKAGEEENIAEQYVTIQNTGTQALNFESISPEHFMVQDITETLESGERIQVWVQPREGLEAGSYEDTITYRSEEGAEASFTAKLVIEESDEAIDPAGDPIEGNDPGTGEPGGGNTPTDPVIQVTADTNAEFPGRVEGYESAPDAVSISLTSTEESTSDVELTAPVSDQGANSVFVIGGYTDLEGNVLPAGGSTSFTVQPKTGLPAGTYEETLSVYNAGEDEATRQPLAVITAAFTVEAVSRGLTVSASKLDFGSVQVGYGEVQAQSVTVTNTGNVKETLRQPAGTNFVVSSANADDLVLQPGGSVTFAVQPKTGLDVNTYEETISITSEEGSAAKVAAAFTVTARTNKLIKIYQPNEITGLSNAVSKDAKSLKLPSTVVIETTNGKVKAAVSWDVKNSSYNAKSTEKQTFTVKGTVTLPDGVQNPDNVSLNTSVKVSVKAYSPKLASADNNQITGISVNGGYTTQSKISFTAVGAGMNNTSPRKGDTRYVPLNWTVINTNSWDKAPYTGTFGLAQSGDYTLSVVFKQQKYDGSNWTDTGERDTKKVAFSVTKAKTKSTNPGVDLTPVPKSNRTKAVKTGDDTNVLPFVIALVVAAGCAAGVVIYRKKK